MSKREFTDDELIRRVWDVEEIKKVVNKRVYYQTNEWREQELNDLWVSEDANKATASFGKNTGYYVGMDEIKKYYVDHHIEDRKAQLAAISAANPEIANTEENLHIGCLVSHPVSTGLVELAGDGKTAKGIWYSIGQETTANPDGTGTALWEPGKVAYDFIKEGDEWKIWHLVEANDLYSEAGENYSEQEVYHNYETNPIDIEFGEPTIKVITHNTDFNWWDNYPAMPEPYDTWSDDISYGPEGFKPVNYGMNSKEGGNWR